MKIYLDRTQENKEGKKNMGKEERMGHMRKEIMEMEESGANRNQNVEGGEDFFTENRKKIKSPMRQFRSAGALKEPGLDGILVTIGLCIIALLLCVVMKDSITTFIRTLVTGMTNKANTILSGFGCIGIAAGKLF